jgi:U2 small nuclear ribonucleoprotein A'
MGNLVTQLPNYRLYLIHHLPTLRVLDFQKVTGKERAEAARKFATPAEGAQVIKDIQEREAAMLGSAAESGAVGKKRRASERAGEEDEAL